MVHLKRHVSSKLSPVKDDQSGERFTLKFGKLKWFVPQKEESFWPFYGICFVAEYDSLLEEIDERDVVLDAGANVGIFTLLAAKKANLVVAVEPDSENYSNLVDNIEANSAKNVVPIQSALSNYVGEGHISGRGPLAALSEDGRHVHVTEIDELLRRMKVRGVSIVKMDIEGAEVQALAGEYLTSVRKIAVELHDNQSYNVLSGYLRAKGFVVEQWRFSHLIVLGKVVKNFRDFLAAELKTRFTSTKLILRYVIGLGGHPVPAAEEGSGIKIIVASQARSERKSRSEGRV